jgi:hypothetical protein
MISVIAPEDCAIAETGDSIATWTDFPRQELDLGYRIESRIHISRAP